MSNNNKFRTQFKLKPILVILCILVFAQLSIFIASGEDNASETFTHQEMLRQQEIEASNTIAIIILLLIIIPIGVYFGTEKMLEQKHLKRAKKVAPKAKEIIDRHKEKEKENEMIRDKFSLNKLKKDKEIYQKISLQKKYLQNTIEKKRFQIKDEKKNIIFSEFEEEDKEHFLRPILNTKKYSKPSGKTDVFLSLSDLGKNNENDSQNSTTKDKLIFDKLDKLE